MLRCVHGWPFHAVRLENNPPRIVEQVWCLHCGEMYTDTAWYSDCCWNPFYNRYEDVAILNSGSYCMLCNDCMSKLGHLGQLSEDKYHKDFEFYYE